MASSKSDDPNTWSPWRPLPVGATMVIFVGPLSIAFLIISILEQSIGMGMLALLLGAGCIFETGGAAFHAGLRQGSKPYVIRKE